MQEILVKYIISLPYEKSSLQKLKERVVKKVKYDKRHGITKYSHQNGFDFIISQKRTCIKLKIVTIKNNKMLLGLSPSSNCYSYI